MAARYALYGLLLALAVFAGLVAAIPSTDDFSPDNPLWNGLSRLSERYGATLVAAAEVGGLPSNSTVLVVGPSLGLAKAEVESVRRFLEGGGRVVVADDFGTANELLAGLGVDASLAGSLLSDDLLMHRSPRLPRAWAYLGSRTYELYLNYATVVNAGSPEGCVAFSSPFSYLDADLDGSRSEGEPYGPFCVAYVARVGTGELVVLSDSSVFVNSMVDLGDNGAFVEELLGSGRVYVVADKWTRGLYAAVRSGLVGAVLAAYTSNLRYLTLTVTCLAMYVGLEHIGRRLREERGGAPLDEVIRGILERNRGWSEEVLRRLARDLGHG